MVTLASIQGFLGALRGAKEIVFDTYILQGRGEVFEALEEACRRGAHVVVRVEKDPYENPGGGVGNADAVEKLRALGADAQVCINSHFKGAVIDGIGYLDDCNWKQDGSDTILRDDAPEDVGMIRDAVFGKTDPSTSSFTTEKDDALAEEEALLASAVPGEDIIIETESISYGSIVGKLYDLADTKHCHIRLIINKRDFTKPGGHREIGALKWLEQSGVEVRLSDATEKFAVVGSRAWIGSTNISIEDARRRKYHSNVPDTIDWGMRTGAASIVSHLDDAFERRWWKALSGSFGRQ